MAPRKQGHLHCVLLSAVLISLAKSTLASQSSDLLSKLLNKDGGKPIVVALDNNDFLSQLTSSSLSSNSDKSSAPTVYVYQLGQPNSQSNRDNGPRQYNSNYRNKRYRPKYNDRDTQPKERHHSQARHDRYHQRQNRYKENRYRDIKPLRTNDRVNEEQERRDREQQDKDREDREVQDREDREDNRETRDREQNNQVRAVDKERRDRDEVPYVNKNSAQAQIPVVRSLLRSLRCSARDECQDECGGPEKNDCEDECEEKFECEEEEDPCDTCETTTSRPKCTGSTKGERLETEKPGCKRC